MTNREILINEIAEELRKKSLTNYHYGGYVFYPNGEIKQKSYVSELKKSLNIDKVSTKEALVNIEKIDPYLLADTLSDLQQRANKTRDPFYGDWNAERIVEEEEREKQTWLLGLKMLAERSIISEYVRGVEHLPIRVEPTSDYNAWMNGLGDWCDINSSNIPKESSEVCDKFRKRWIEMINYVPEKK